jgi:hypothetical protein
VLWNVFDYGTDSSFGNPTAYHDRLATRCTRDIITSYWTTSFLAKRPLATSPRAMNLKVCCVIIGLSQGEGDDA